MIKLKRYFSGEYGFEGVIDGFNIRVEAANNESYRGFGYQVYVNDVYMMGEGFTGLRLYSIKLGIDGDVQDCIKEYKLETGL